MASQMNNEPGYMGGRLFACNVNIQALDHHVPVVLLIGARASIVSPGEPRPEYPE